MPSDPFREFSFGAPPRGSGEHGGEISGGLVVPSLLRAFGLDGQHPIARGQPESVGHVLGECGADGAADLAQSGLRTMSPPEA